jgi:hypothetical protein
MSKQISKFEINSYGEVKITTNSVNGSTEHTYYNVPKRIILKLLNSSKEPNISDFDGWLSDWRGSQSKNKPQAQPFCAESFWTDSR